MSISTSTSTSTSTSMSMSMSMSSVSTRKSTLACHCLFSGERTEGAR
jgi:hypothetical protein